jgi:hypothetical protein
MILKVKVPLESSKDTREYQEGLDSTPVDKLQLGTVGYPGGNPLNGNAGAAGATGGATSALGGQNIARNERI